MITQGYDAKTILIPASNAVRGSTLLGANSKPGLPAGVLVYGFIMRSTDKSKTYLGSETVPQSVINNSFIHLKFRDNRQRLLINGLPLLRVVGQALLIDPVISEEINWQESYIATNNTGLTDMAAGNVQSFELVVLYQHRDCNSTVGTLPTEVHLRTGRHLRGVKYQKKMIRLNGSAKKYSLIKSGGLGIPNDALLLGVRIEYSSTSDPQLGNRITQESFNAGFISLKDDQGGLFVENLPFSLTNSEWFDELDYFPVNPKFSKEIDWQSSFVEFFEPVADGEVLELGIYYTFPNSLK